MTNRHLFFSVFLLVLLLLGGTPHALGIEPLPNKEIRRSIRFMETTAEIALYDKQIPKAEQAIELAFSELRLLDTLFNHKIKGGDLEQLNTLAGKQPYRAKPKTFHVLKRALNLAKESQGKFMPFTPPTSLEEIVLNSDLFEVQFRRPNITIQLKEIGYGYAAEAAVAILKQSGIETGVVNIGGVISCFGKRPFHFKIKHPRETKFIKQIVLQDEAIGTGEEKKVPSSSPLPQYTVVVGKKAEMLGGLAKALLYLPEAEGRKLLKAYQVEGLWVYARPDGTIQLNTSAHFPAIKEK